MTTIEEPRTSSTARAEGDSPLRSNKPSGGDRAVAVASHVVLAVWALIILIPLLWSLLSSFKSSSEIISGSPFAMPETWLFSNYARAWSDAGIGRYFFNTVVVVGSALVLVMLLGSMCAYVLARYTFPGRRFIYYLMLAGLTFPVFLAIVPLFFVLQSLALLNTLPGLILTYVAFALPFTVFFLYAFFRTLPEEIAEAAAIDGCGDWRTFFSVMLPMAKPGLASVTIFNFLGLWNQYLIPVAINTRQENWVLAQGMGAYAGQIGYEIDFGGLFAAVIITIAPVLIVYVIFQRQVQNSVTGGALK
ncbi:carbohydrate ABC transporter permease [Auraticoccus monumenti]|uniref:Carbohydrate ABC transporter membrane protein 2, CUT1 family n=1 Tax=Auraticoccus monumenti TaxID=675864 RepID=A0A1G6SFX1_9ACTN|nr:carbohydrate ABC transporter permease [Auraticoccus monumenti]SDD15015.1 carbohydrate ABC transporter membrane protein 2, CUT1 family [Auraticoccus monumenti]